MTSLPENSAPIPGYEGAYRITRCGEVWSQKRGRWRRMRSWVEHGSSTVTLYRYGERSRHRISVLLRSVFGEKKEPAPGEFLDLFWYVRMRYGDAAANQLERGAQV